MRLMDKPFTREEKDDALRMLNGCIARICVSDNPIEIIRIVGFANDYISMLAQSNMLEIKRRKERRDDDHAI